jgi:hypothetical protein
LYFFLTSSKWEPSGYLRTDVHIMKLTLFTLRTHPENEWCYVVMCGGVDGEVRVASRGQEIVSVASQGDRFKCISCVPRLERNCISCVPGLSTRNMSCVPRLVRNCISCIERYGCTKCPTVGRFLQFYCTLYTHTQLLNDIDSTVVISCYCLMFKPY